jgi:hypothetical protein
MLTEISTSLKSSSSSVSKITVASDKGRGAVDLLKECSGSTWSFWNISIPDCLSVAESMVEAARK